MSKQDRQGVRTPADVERKYNLGKLASQGASPQTQEIISRLNQTLNRYMATTDAALSALDERLSTMEEQSPGDGNTGGATARLSLAPNLKGTVDIEPSGTVEIIE